MMTNSILTESNTMNEDNHPMNISSDTTVQIKSDVLVESKELDDIPESGSDNDHTTDSIPDLDDTDDDETILQPTIHQSNNNVILHSTTANSSVADGDETEDDELSSPSISITTSRHGIPSIHNTASTHRRSRGVGRMDRVQCASSLPPGKLIHQSSRTGTGKFYDYLKINGIILNNIHDVTVQQLYEYLPKFIQSLRQTDGTYYSTNTVRSYIGGLQRELKSSPQYANINFNEIPGVTDALQYIKTQQFIQLNKPNNVMLHKSYHNINHNVVPRAQPVESKDELLMQSIDTIIYNMYHSEQESFDATMSMGYITLIQFITMLVTEYGIYKLYEIYSLNITQFAVLQNDDTTLRYISYLPNNTNIDATRSQQLSTIQPAENKSNTNQCCVTILEQYLIHRPLDVDHIVLLQFIDRCSSTDDIWYTTAPLNPLLYILCIRHIVDALDKYNVTIHNNTDSKLIRQDMIIEEQYILHSETSPQPTPKRAKLDLQSNNNINTTPQQSYQPTTVPAAAIPQSYSGYSSDMPLMARPIDYSLIHHIATPMSTQHINKQITNQYELNEYIHTFQLRIDGIRQYVDACQDSLNQLRHVQLFNTQPVKPINKFV